MNILQVSTADAGGGAEKIAWNLFQSYRKRRHESWLAVGRKVTDDPDVLVIPNDQLRTAWGRLWLRLTAQVAALNVRGASRVSHALSGVAEPLRWLDVSRGIEDFHFPGTQHLLNLGPKRPEIAHLHNLHGGYFDLRVLPWICRQLPIILTLHDAWLLSGHCAHSLGCDRWKIGCGDCPDLNSYPALRRDGTRRNWRRKQSIYEKSRFCVATPSRWLMDKVEQSILARAVIESRVIPNGVDLGVFHEADRRAARAALGLPQNAKILLFAANRARANTWKDFETLESAISLVSTKSKAENLLFVTMGEEASAKRIGNAEVRFIAYQRSPETVARYYQAADIYVHAARADTFPNTVIESLACGTPVVATAVGGIPEQVKGLQSGVARSATCLNTHTVDDATGILTPPGDAEALAVAVDRLLNEENLRQRLGENAVQDARKRFGLDRQVDSYLSWYTELLTTETFGRPVIPKSPLSRLS